jgi:hypothetical protein
MKAVPQHLQYAAHCVSLDCPIRHCQLGSRASDDTKQVRDLRLVSFLLEGQQIWQVHVLEAFVREQNHQDACYLRLDVFPLLYQSWINVMVGLLHRHHGAQFSKGHITYVWGGVMFHEMGCQVTNPWHSTSQLSIKIHLGCPYI